jgi:hypothetical protein
VRCAQEGLELAELAWRQVRRGAVLVVQVLARVRALTRVEARIAREDAVQERREAAVVVVRRGVPHVDERRGHVLEQCAARAGNRQDAVLELADRGRHLERIDQVEGVERGHVVPDVGIRALRPPLHADRIRRVGPLVREVLIRRGRAVVALRAARGRREEDLAALDGCGRRTAVQVRVPDERRQTVDVVCHVIEARAQPAIRVPQVEARSCGLATFERHGGPDTVGESSRRHIAGAHEQREANSEVLDLSFLFQWTVTIGFELSRGRCFARWRATRAARRAARLVSQLKKLQLLVI